MTDKISPSVSVKESPERRNIGISKLRTKDTHINVDWVFLPQLAQFSLWPKGAQSSISLGTQDQQETLIEEKHRVLSLNKTAGPWEQDPKETETLNNWVSA